MASCLKTLFGSRGGGSEKVANAPPTTKIDIVKKSDSQLTLNETNWSNSVIGLQEINAIINKNVL